MSESRVFELNLKKALRPIKKNAIVEDINAYRHGLWPGAPAEHREKAQKSLQAFNEVKKEEEDDEEELRNLKKVLKR